MAASSVSPLDPFDCDKGDIEYYLEQFEYSMTLNSTQDDVKRASALIAAIGKDAYQILQTICAPDDPKTKSCPQLETLLKEYFARREFYQRNQGPMESFPAYRAKLEKLCQKCNFGAFAKDALRDRLACGKRATEEDPSKKIAVLSTAAPNNDALMSMAVKVAITTETKSASPQLKVTPGISNSKAPVVFRLVNWRRHAVVSFGR